MLGGARSGHFVLLGEGYAICRTCARRRQQVIFQVGSVEAAQRAAAGGVDVIIAQGSEAGGHVEGEVATMALAPRIVDAVAPLPVAVAAGIADARGMVAALALGAEAVVLGAPRRIERASAV